MRHGVALAWLTRVRAPPPLAARRSVRHDTLQSILDSTEQLRGELPEELPKGVVTADDAIIFFVRCAPPAAPWTPAALQPCPPAR